MQGVHALYIRVP